MERKLNFHDPEMKRIVSYYFPWKEKKLWNVKRFLWQKHFPGDRKFNHAYKWITMLLQTIPGLKTETRNKIQITWKEQIVSGLGFSRVSLGLNIMISYTCMMIL